MDFSKPSQAENVAVSTQDDLQTSIMFGILGSLRRLGFPDHVCAVIMERRYRMRVDAGQKPTDALREIERRATMRGLPPQPHEISARQITALRRTYRAWSRSTTDPRKPPDYTRLRTYQATADELGEIGFSSVTELVAAFNRLSLETGGFPVSQGDYPSTKTRFERLVKRWNSMSRRT